MAKGSFLGVKRGKLGDAVGYNVTNSNNKDTQGWRVYQPVVSNPQTDGQIDQRVKMAAANNLYRALKPIIQRGWQNHKYGDESRRAFLRRAMGSEFVGPYLPKGSTLAVPIEGVPITYGSLPPVVVDCPGAGVLPVLLSVVTPDGTTTDTMGDISTHFITSGMAQAGDQVTFVLGWIPDTTNYVVYREISFIIDPTDVRTTEEGIGVTFSTSVIEDMGRLAIDVFTDFDYSGYDYCFLCAVSRNGDTANLRSYAEFAMTDSFRAMFYGNQQQDAAARRSYRKQQSADTNWPLVPGGEGGGGGSTVTAFTLSGTEIVPGSLTNVAAEPAEIVDANGQRYFVRAHTSAGGTRYLYGQGGGDFTSSATAPTGATNANTIDPCAANNIASGCRAWLLAKGVSADLLVTT